MLYYDLGLLQLLGSMFSMCPKRSAEYLKILNDQVPSKYFFFLDGTSTFQNDDVRIYWAQIVEKSGSGSMRHNLHTWIGFALRPLQ